MKVSLIQPLHADHVVVPRGKSGIFKPAQLTMPLIAAHTPPEFEVEIHDEIAGPLDLDRIDGDVVGLTAVTPFAPRAYQLATQLRARGKTVVMGGPHATALPHEAARYVDAVVVGEGDVLWPEVLRDWRAGRLRSIYRNRGPVPLAGLPRPRFDLLERHRYLVPEVVQATRGCPFTCDFCSLRNVFPGYRTRPVRDVIEEIERIPNKHVVFWDDNIIGDPVWAREFFRELAPLGKRWFSQATITIARTRGLAELAGKSGCGGLFVGLESFSSESLAGTNKAFNKAQHYKRDLRKLADNGIGVMSGLIFGFDEDGPDVFERTLEGAIEIGLAGVACSILTPYPGTGLFNRMRAAGRLTHYDWSRYTSDEVVFTPTRMSARRIIDGHNWVGREFHSYRSMVKRWARIGFMQPYLYWLSNLANRRYFAMLAGRGHTPSEFEGEPDPPAEADAGAAAGAAPVTEPRGDAAIPDRRRSLPVV